MADPRTFAVCLPCKLMPYLATMDLALHPQVFVLGSYKLVVAQQEPVKTNSGPTLGWKCGGTGHTRCNTTVSAQ